MKEANEWCLVWFGNKSGEIKDRSNVKFVVDYCA